MTRDALRIRISIAMGKDSVRIYDGARHLCIPSIFLIEATKVLSSASGIDGNVNKLEMRAPSEHVAGNISWVVGVPGHLGLGDKVDEYEHAQGCHVREHGLELEELQLSALYY
ncbi:hypothetical protein D9619_004609 [Psilocybe cf. subviscida]|uniref:Uncharacterized protein n=1 Tax=Psilocybe cf. subviscida TaxID=2480587 RepID=A0A8H5BPZ5_9AGAR|nr:hypothetical protein D9619_004609 [Psilocybe cf. subviscida]